MLASRTKDSDSKAAAAAAAAAVKLYKVSSVLWEMSIGRVFPLCKTHSEQAVKGLWATTPSGSDNTKHSHSSAHSEYSILVNLTSGRSGHYLQAPRRSGSIVQRFRGLVSRKTDRHDLTTRVSNALPYSCNDTNEETVVAPEMHTTNMMTRRKYNE